MSNFRHPTVESLLSHFEQYAADHGYKVEFDFVDYQPEGDDGLETRYYHFYIWKDPDYDNA